MIAIIDYGVGNLFSLKSSLDAVGAPAVVTGDAGVIRSADKLILPGVGAFRDARRKLLDTGLFEVVREEAFGGKPLLGICLGMQMLFERSYEGGIYEGLGLLPGEVRPIEEVIPKGLKIPEIGWNALRYLKPCPLFRHVPEGTEVYFVHSYAAMDAPDAVAVNEYGADLTAAAARGNLYGCQFHPEKSGRAGLEILRTFAEEIR
ncbi:MAG: imidazole glycerol phosphate synthase subunit HisH [Lachnospiraceae bacterium]|nr:imidazole glycerol phosphate synthase subunit HisH [Lachnospiraceae bacterium]